MYFFNEILLFIEGDVKYTIEAETHKLKPSDIIIIPAGKYHFPTVNKKIKYERYVLKFPNEILNQYLKNAISRTPYFHHSSPENSVLIKSFDEYINEYDSEALAILLSCKTVELILSITRERVEHYEGKDSLINRTIKYVNDNLYKNINLGRLSVDMNYSQSYISNVFKEAMHCSLMQYIKSKKIITAYDLIERGSKPIDVSESLGFKDYSTFYRSFIKIIGFPPSAKKSKI